MLSLRKQLGIDSTSLWISNGVMKRIPPKYIPSSVILTKLVECTLQMALQIVFGHQFILNWIWHGLTPIHIKGEIIHNPSFETFMVHPRKLIRIGSPHLVNPSLFQSCQLWLHRASWHVHAPEKSMSRSFIEHDMFTIIGKGLQHPGAVLRNLEILHPSLLLRRLAV